MDFVKREESNIMDEENYKIYMENVSSKFFFVFAYVIMNVKLDRLLSLFYPVILSLKIFFKFFN